VTRRNRSDNSYTSDLAHQLFQMWHEKTPQKLIEEDVDFPKEVFAVGQATHILYESDKWEEDGKFIRYIHKFTSLPTLFAQGESVFPKDVEPYDKVKTPKLMGVTKLDGEEYGFPVLARVCALRWTDGYKSRKITFKSYKPIMSCSVNQRTVVIFADEILLINGGTMVVAAPGIMD